MAMKLKFKVQPYQTLAVDAVVDCFAGQPFASGPTYRIDPGKRNQAEAFDDEGFRNTDFALTEAQLLDNIKAVQRRQNLPQSASLHSFVTRDTKGKACRQLQPISRIWRRSARFISMSRWRPARAKPIATSSRCSS